MTKHSKCLDDTALWKTYRKDCGEERSIWVKKIYDAAVEYLKDVRNCFKNYTLHDEKHVLNVIDAMGGLLGDYIEKLTTGEMELLILASCFT